MKLDLRSASHGLSEGKSLARRFEARVAERPQAAALTLGGESLTYAELNARANRLAAHLRRLGVTADTLVGIHLDRSFDLIVAVMATLKAGGAYLPLDMACPEDRLRFQVRDAKAKVVLTDSKLAGRFEAGSVPVIRMDADAAVFANESAENVPADTTPANLAYVIYTSGSTGQPKGVSGDTGECAAAVHA